MGSKAKSLLSAALPIAGTLLAPGVGTALGSSLSSAALSGIGGALGGAAGGALNGGGLSSALKGAAIGGTGGYLSGGGLSNILGGTALGDSLGIGGTQLPWQSPTGSIAGAGAQLPWQTPTGAASGGLLSGVGLGGGSSSYSTGNALSSVLGGVNSTFANDSAEKDLLAAQRQALSRYQPYVDAKFEPGDLTQDPGYQFRLQEGEKAINRSLGARGKVFSGEALKASQDYGQGLADTTYNEAYNRFLQQNAQNIGVAGALAGLDQEAGNVKASAGINNSNVLNRTLSSVLGGYGAYTNTGAPNGQRIVGFDQTGKPIYA